MGKLRLILGDQLSMQMSSLKEANKQEDLILITEVMEEATYVRHHKKKIAFLFAAMRHFADALKEEGFEVRYVALDDADNAGSLRGEVARALEEVEGVSGVVVTKPGEYRLIEDMEAWSDLLGVPVELMDDTRFISTIEEFADWAKDRKQLRMEYFYREMRKKTGLLMEDGKPAGGEWNYDADNRKKLPKGKATPERFLPEPDAVTREVIGLVEERFGEHFGDLEPFYFATTRAGAEEARDHFISDILPCFGDYQDAMAMDEPWMWHSLLSMYLNCGLLDPMDVCERAAAEWTAGRAPLNAVEGFIRQIIGWREYVRGLYWYSMPDYKTRNALKAERELPEFFWTGETDMNCLAQSIGQTKRHAYAHHIQRLMVIGNFALLAGLSPAAVNDWYLLVYVDAYEWVELPNTHGMALFADDGVIASKPYAASANYINKMSDYCGSCRYAHTKKAGEDACPFNYLYWDLVARHEDKWSDNPRMGFALKTLERMDEGLKDDMRASAEEFLKAL